MCLDLIEPVPLPESVIAYKIMRKHIDGNEVIYASLSYRRGERYFIGQSYHDPETANSIPLKKNPRISYQCGFHAYVGLRDAGNRHFTEAAECIVEVRLTHITAYGIQDADLVWVAADMELIREIKC